MAPYSNYHLSSDQSSIDNGSVLTTSAQLLSSEDLSTVSLYSTDHPATMTISPRSLHPSFNLQIQEQQQKIAAMTDIALHISATTTSRSNTQIVPVTSGHNTNNSRCDDPPLLLTEAIHPNKYKMKQQRRGTTAIGIVSGAVIGTMVFPVLGTAVGGAAAGYACNKLSKRGERRAQRRWEQTSFQRQALQSHTVNAEYV
jgi:uncharacterized protein YcfJ